MSQKIRKVSKLFLSFSLFLKFYVLAKLNTYRELFAERYLTDYSFWQNWILDITITKSFDDVLNLYERAFVDCPSNDLILDFIDYCTQIQDDDKIVSL